MGGGVTLGYAPLWPGNSVDHGGGGHPGLCTSITWQLCRSRGWGSPWGLGYAPLWPGNLGGVAMGYAPLCPGNCRISRGLLPWIMHPCDLATPWYIIGVCYLSYAASWQCGVFHQLKMWNWRFVKRLHPLCIMHRGSLITGCLLHVQHNLQLMCTVNPGSQIPLLVRTLSCSLNDNLMATSMA